MTTDPIATITAITEAMRDLQRLRASRKVHAALAEATHVDLSQQAVQVLVALDGTLPVAQLAQAARMDVGAVSRQVRVLEADGYVTKAPSPENASVVLVTATPRGAEVADRIRAVRNDHVTRALAGWSATDRRALAVLLRRLVDDLQSTPYAEDAPAA
jgi:DNA-binding MarR family transcriptional regulator